MGIGDGYKFDYLIASVFDENIYDAIIQDAENLGISRDIILPLRIFQIPFFNFEDYIKIKDSNVSIISESAYKAKALSHQKDYIRVK